MDMGNAGIMTSPHAPEELDTKCWMAKLATAMSVMIHQELFLVLMSQLRMLWHGGLGDRRLGEIGDELEAGDGEWSGVECIYGNCIYEHVEDIDFTIYGAICMYVFGCILCRYDIDIAFGDIV